MADELNCIEIDDIYDIFIEEVCSLLNGFKTRYPVKKVYNYDPTNVPVARLPYIAVEWVEGKPERTSRETFDVNMRCYVIYYHAQFNQNFNSKKMRQVAGKIQRDLLEHPEVLGTFQDLNINDVGSFVFPKVNDMLGGVRMVVDVGFHPAIYPPKN